MPMLPAWRTAPRRSARAALPLLRRMRPWTTWTGVVRLSIRWAAVASRAGEPILGESRLETWTLERSVCDSLELSNGEVLASF